MVYVDESGGERILARVRSKAIHWRDAQAQMSIAEAELSRELHWAREHGVPQARLAGVVGITRSRLGRLMRDAT